MDGNHTANVVEPGFNSLWLHFSQLHRLFDQVAGHSGFLLAALFLKLAGKKYK